MRDSISRASRFIARSTASVCCSRSSSTTSALLTTITLANSICSASRSTTPRVSSAPACCPWSASSALLLKSRRKFCPSTTVTSVSSRAMSLRQNPSSSRTENVAATGIGSAMPVDSISR
ncbi:hypothetical protein D9M71_707350 [compost metagenome]